MQQMVVDEQQVIAWSWTGAICKGTWGGNPVPVRFILITDCRQNVLTRYWKVCIAYICSWTCFKGLWACHLSTANSQVHIILYYFPLENSFILIYLNRYFGIEHFDRTLRQHCEQASTASITVQSIRTTFWSVYLTKL
jgi:hypothetical protein